MDFGSIWAERVAEQRRGEKMVKEGKRLLRVRDGDEMNTNIY